jgi:SAM-dependent methyltransferase
MTKAGKWRRMFGLLDSADPKGAEPPPGAAVCNVCGFVATDEMRKSGRIRICPNCDTNQRQRSFKQLFTLLLEPEVFSSGAWHDALLLSPGAVERSLLAPKFERHVVSSLYQVFPGDNFVRANVVDLAPFPDESFDFVEACNVLDYVPEMEDAIRSIHRVAHPGGMFVLLNQEQNLVEGDADIAVSTRKVVTGTYWPDKTAVTAVSIGRRTMLTMLGRIGFDATEVRLIEPLSEIQCTWWICRRL